MRPNSNPNHFQKLSAFILFFSILSGSFSIGGAQTSFQANESNAADKDESYAQLFRRGRGADFAALLTKNVGATEVGNIEDWLDKNNAGFFRVLNTAFQNEAERVFEEKREKNNPSQSGIVPKSSAPKPIAPAKRKPVGARRAAFDSSNSVFFQNASYQSATGNLFNQASEESFDEPSAAEDLAITKIKTDDGFQMKGASEKSKTVGDVTVTQGATGETRAIMVEGENFGTEYKGVEYVEAVNKKARTSLRTETTIGWRVLTASCPDADGISAGSATMTSAVKITITNPQTIGILTRDVTTRMTTKGFVNDAAELTHFDSEGAATETISGYERAERLGLVENVQFADGTKQLNYQLKNSKIGKSVVNEYGTKTKVGEEMGNLKATSSWDVSDAEVRRINEISTPAVVWLSLQTATFLEAAQSNWRYYGCVEVVLTTPKMKLLPSETAEISAETVHKFDKSKVNAELTSKTAIASAMPEKYAAVTQGSFVLTAPEKGERAYISVESVSRRGINFAMLKFDEERLAKKTPPKKTPPAKKCDGAWSGKITAVKRKIEKIVKPADGRLVRQVENEEETFSIDYHVLGIQDTTKGFVNGYFADAQMNYRAAEYRESNYAAGKMSCDKRIITTPQTIKLESLMTALSSKRITVYISPFGEKGILTFDSPEVNAERIITRTYESSCESYNRVNSSVDRDQRLIGVPSPSFEIHFDLDAKSQHLLVGSKTIENSDGSQTIVTWNLARDCK